MKGLKNILILFFSFFIVSAYSQEFFYEFALPSLYNKESKINIEEILVNNNISDYRVDEYSQKVLFFSNEKLEENTIYKWFIAFDFFPVHYHSGIQGKDSHTLSTIEDANYNKKTHFNQKSIFFIIDEAINEKQKQDIIQNFKLKGLDVVFSSNLKIIILKSYLDFSTGDTKKEFYSFLNKNKLIRLIEVYE